MGSFQAFRGRDRERRAASTPAPKPNVPACVQRQSLRERDGAHFSSRIYSCSFSTVAHKMSDRSSGAHSYVAEALVALVAQAPAGKEEEVIREVRE